MHLEALAVDNGGAALIILLLGDPHLLEGGQGGQDGATDPDRVLPLRGSNDLDFHGGWSQSSELLLHSVSNAWVHGGASGQDSVGIQVLPDVNVTPHDGVEGGLVKAARLHAQERGLEQSLRAPEPLITNGDDLTIRKLIGLLQRRGAGSSSHFLLKVKGNIAELLLDVSDNLPFSSSGESVASLSKDLHEIISKVPSSQIQPQDSMGKSITLIDRDSVRYTITRVHDDTSGPTRSIEGEDSLDVDIHGRGVKGLKHDLGHLLPVGLGVQGSLSQEDRVLLRGHTELIVEGVMPDLLHVIPVGNNTMLNWVLQSQDTPLGLSLVSNIGILLSHSNHNTSVPGAAHDGREDSPGGVIAGETSLAHAGAIVNHQRRNFVVTHVEGVVSV